VPFQKKEINHINHQKLTSPLEEKVQVEIYKEKKRMVSTVLKERTKPIHPSHKTYQFVWRESPGWNLKKKKEKNVPQKKEINLIIKKNV
jgi:hypothetical protein